jgi:hypothetical protein
MLGGGQAACASREIRIYLCARGGGGGGYVGYVKLSHSLELKPPCAAIAASRLCPHHPQKGSDPV